MTKKQIKNIIKYWQKVAEHDYKTMLWLFKGKRYSDALFFGHIVLEKILKGIIVESTKKQPPQIHDLVRLKEIAKLELTEGQVNLLDQVNDFNIRARYPEFKLEFYKKCDKKYTEKYLNKIIELYKNLCQKLKQEK